MTATFFHVGVIVDDLDAAIDSYGKSLGLMFTEPATGRLEDFVVNGVRTPTEVRFTYSAQGPPHYELIEALPDGIYGRDQVGGIHHLGMWVDDLEGAIAEYNARGIEIEAVYRLPDGSPYVVYFRSEGLLGVRHEILGPASRALFEARISAARAAG